MLDKKLLKEFDQLFDHQLIDEISEIGILKHYKKDDIVIDIGQELKYIPLLLKGNIKVFREDDHGRELLLYFLESGDTCSMSLTCCLGQSKSKIRASADKDSDLIMIPVSAVHKWFQNNASWRNYVLESYQLRFNEMLEIIDALAFMKMDQRLYKYLTDKVKLNSSEIVENTHQEISENLNTSRVVISRILKQLENEGKIRLGRHKIEVLEF